MFSLTVFVGTGMWSLMFKNKDQAEAAYGMISNPDLFTGVANLVDDFGHQMMLRPGSVHGAVLEDMDQSKLAHCERALHQQRTQITAQSMAQADATIRNARMTSGPAVLTPQGANGRMF